MTFSGVSYISDNPFLSRMRGPYVFGYLLCPFSLLQSTYTVCLSPAWSSAFQDLFYCHRDNSSHADGIGLVCCAGGTCALLTPISVKGTIVRAKAKALLKTRTQKWLFVKCQLALLCVLPYISNMPLTGRESYDRNISFYHCRKIKRLRMKGVNLKFDTLVQISHFREAVPAARTLIQHVHWYMISATQEFSLRRFSVLCD